MSDSLLIVGCGRLGSRLGKLWVQQYGNVVVGETASESRHAELKSYGIVPRVVGEEPGRQFPNVVFAVAPEVTTSVESYVTEVKRAISLWSGEGSLVFTSSGSVYKENDGKTVTETSETHKKGSSVRTDRMLLAEEEVLKGGGTVVRLSGLYDRAAWDHGRWAEISQSMGPGFCINLVDRDDAATLIEAVLLRTASARGWTLLCVSCSGVLQTIVNKYHMMSGQASKVDETPVKPFGKICDASWTKSVTGWEPTHNLLEELAEKNKVHEQVRSVAFAHSAA